MNLRHSSIPLAWMLALLLVLEARAHDLWLQPSLTAGVDGPILEVSLLVGDHLEVEQELPLSRRLVSRFVLTGSDAVIDLEAELPPEKEAPRIQPILRRPFPDRGTSVVIMEHGAIETEFSTAKFRRYLRREGLDPEAFELKGDEQRERYRRSLRAVVSQGKPSAAIPSTGSQLFADLELLTNPHQRKVGETLTVRMTVEGQPLQGQPITALFRRASDGTVSSWTEISNEKGQADFVMQDKGFWVVRTVYVRPDPQGDVEWESAWLVWSFQHNAGLPE